MIEVQGLTKSFPRRPAGWLQVLDGVDMQVRRDEFVCLLGPSGCGKTTLLKILAGLMPWDSGDIHIQGHPLSGPGPGRAMVFQNFVLLPWATALDNVAFGLEMRGIARQERRAKASTLLRSVGLEGFEGHYPHELSGGMQQRVGLARALAVDPQILLMDEPFGSVDSQTRRLLQEDLLALYDRERKTVLFVTHSMDEAVRLGDRILLFGPRPSRIVESFDVPLGRPRPPEVRLLPQYIELKEALWARLRTMQTAWRPHSDGASHD